MCIVELTVRELRTGHQDSVFGIRIGAGDFYLFRNIQNVSVDHPCTTRIKRPRREANYSLISSNEFNIMSVIIHPRLHLSSSSYRDNFTLGLCTICFELWEGISEDTFPLHTILCYFFPPTLIPYSVKCSKNNNILTG